MFDVYSKTIIFMIKSQSMDCQTSNYEQTAVGTHTYTQQHTEDISIMWTVIIWETAQHRFI